MTLLFRVELRSQRLLGRELVGIDFALNIMGRKL